MKIATKYVRLVSPRAHAANAVGVHVHVHVNLASVAKEAVG